MTDAKPKFTHFRVTKGVARYRVSWWRRVLMRVIGRSHFRRRLEKAND